MAKENTYKENSVLLLEKGKKGILHMVFGRFIIVLISLLAQFIFMIYVFGSFSNYIHLIFSGTVIFNIIIVIYLLNTEDNPSVKNTWLILGMILPILGIFLYVFSRFDIGHRAAKKRLMNMQKHTEQFISDDERILEEVKQKDKAFYNIASYIRSTGSFPIYKEDKVTYFPIGEENFEAIIKKIEQAKKFIFLEYFIIEEGYMWGRILRILAEKVQQGVEVRVMYDGTCEFSRLPHSYPKKLEELGIKCKVFLPIMPIASTLYNYRDHRKILVVDGKVAFTGGVNLADEYINEKQVFGHWKDNAIMVEGKAVASFTSLFLEMWNMDERQEEDYKPWLLPSYEKQFDEIAYTEENKGYLIPYGDDPLDGEHVGKMVYIDILNHAKDYVYIMTPYLILDGEMESAIAFAAKRGVKVKLILPHIPDKKYAFALALNYYKILLKAGVEIYEYTPGFVHAKTFVSDDQKAVVGTFNLDYRSLYHHFECATYMYEVSAIDTIKKDIEDTLEKCQKMNFTNYRKGRIGLILIGKILKFVEPLM